MLNTRLGSTTVIDGSLSILTRRGVAGHALYGPYARLEPGAYAVEFDIKIADDRETADHAICAIIDVASNYGNAVLAKMELRFADLSLNKEGAFYLPFQLDAASCAMEYRVYVTGQAELRITNYCRVIRLGSVDDDYACRFESTKFPSPSTWQSLDTPAMLVSRLRQVYEKGGHVKIEDENVVSMIDDVCFNVKTVDDVRFIGEIFYRNAYNVIFNRPCCVIDIGMNIGLVSLKLAKSASVREVHSFEPFRSTYERALANIRLNPDVSDKIFSHNFGLAAKDEELTVFIADESDSGAFSIRGARSGAPKRIAVKNAATVLEPIIRSARHRNLDVIAKVDCEGSEFQIFDRLEEHKLLHEISAFMVEWHRLGDGKTQRDLIEPLLRQDFLVFDVSGTEGNGFFYAVRSPVPSTQPAPKVLVFNR